MTNRATKIMKNGEPYFFQEFVDDTGITVSPASFNLDNIGDTQQLTATVLPLNATLKNVTRSVNNDNASVSNTGLVTRLAQGDSTITCTTISGFTASSIMLGSWWLPGEDTILYYDFEHTSGITEIDVAGKVNGTYQSTPTINTLSSGKKYFDSLGTNALNTSSTLSTLNYNNATVCVWFNMRVTNKAFFGQEWWSVQGGTIFCENYQGNTQFALGNYVDSQSTSLSTNTWYNVAIVNNSTTSTLYINGIQIKQKSISTSTGNKYFHLGGVPVYNPSSPPTVGSDRTGHSYFGSVIIENKVWTSTDVVNYYNQTKSLYGL